MAGGAGCPAPSGQMGGGSRPSTPATPSSRTGEVSIPLSMPSVDDTDVPGLAASSLASAEESIAREAAALAAKQDSRRRPMLLLSLGLAALAACAAVAALTASEDGSDGGSEVIGSMKATVRATPRRASSNVSVGHVEARGDAGPHSQGCRTVVMGEPCYRHVMWAMQHGIHEKPDWYPGLSATSSFEEFQGALAEKDEFAECPQPCGLRTGAGGQHWCSATAPGESLSLKDCSASKGSQGVKALTYNLFWWNLFGRRKGNGGSAGNLIRGAAASGPFDVMAFQEADDVWWPLRDAGLSENEYESESALGMAVVWRTTAWRKLATGVQRIAEDRPDQWYGARGVLWVRLQSRTTDRTLLFANHHGPLPVGTGGICGGEATAFNMLRLLQRIAGPGDVIILTGDFNADAGSETFRTLLPRINHVYTGSSFGGVDHFFSNCAGPSVLQATNLGSGGSDHDALMVVFHV